MANHYYGRIPNSESSGYNTFYFINNPRPSEEFQHLFKAMLIILNSRDVFM